MLSPLVNPQKSKIRQDALNKSLAFQRALLSTN